MICDDYVMIRNDNVMMRNDYVIIFSGNQKSTTNLYKNRNVQRISFGPREKCNSKFSKLLDRKGNDSTANGIVRNISKFRIYTR